MQMSLSIASVLWHVAFLVACVECSSAKNHHPIIVATRDPGDASLIHISGINSAFDNQLLTDEAALTNAPPENATHPTTPGTATKRDGETRTSDTTATWGYESESILRFDLSNPIGVIGATLSFAEEQTFYGVWEYPFNEALGNANTTYDVKGLYGLKTCRQRLGEW